MSTSSRSRPSLRAAAVLAAPLLLVLTGCGADEPAVEADAPSAAAPSPAAAPTAEVDPSPAEESQPVEEPSTTPAPVESSAAPAPAPSEEPEAAPAPSEAPAEVVITMVDFAYEMPESVAPGTTVTVVNEDSTAHSATSVGEFDVNLTAGESGTFTAPDEPGEYRIICLFHGNMVATLVVA